MSNRRIAFIAGLCVTAGLLAAFASAPAAELSRSVMQDPPDVQEGAQDSPPSMEHEFLMKRAGEYTTASTFTFGEGMEPDKSTGSATIKAVLGGRFLAEESQDTMMGQAVRGQRLLGYHDGTGEYEANWVYSMSNAMLHMKGTSADGGKTITLKGEVSEGGDQKETLVVVLNFTSDDSFTMTLSAGAEAGAAGPVMETVYTRKK